MCCSFFFCMDTGEEQNFSFEMLLLVYCYVCIVSVLFSQPHTIFKDNCLKIWSVTFTYLPLLILLNVYFSQTIFQATVRTVTTLVNLSVCTGIFILLFLSAGDHFDCPLHLHVHREAKTLVCNLLGDPDEKYSPSAKKSCNSYETCLNQIIFQLTNKHFTSAYCFFLLFVCLFTVIVGNAMEKDQVCTLLCSCNKYKMTGHVC